MGLIKFDLLKPGQEKTAFNFTVVEETYTKRKGGETTEEKIYQKRNEDKIIKFWYRNVGWSRS